MEYSETITQKRGLFDRLMGRSSLPGVVAANQIIAVWGTQGGVGCSSITAIFAKLLHQWGFTVLVIEATQTGGSFLRLMGKKPVAKGLDTISRNKERLTSELDSIKVSVVKGLNVLPRSGAPYNAQWLWQEDEARKLFRLARKLAAFVLVDAGHVLSDPLSRAALTECDHIISIFRPTPIGLDAATRFHEHCKFANLNENILWLTNQTQITGAKEDFEFLTGKELKHSIPWDKNFGFIEYGGTISKNAQAVAEEVLQEIISAPSARIF